MYFLSVELKISVAFGQNPLEPKIPVKERINVHISFLPGDYTEY